MELWECCSHREVQATHTGLFFLLHQGVLGPEERLPNLLWIWYIISGMLKLDASVPLPSSQINVPITCWDPRSILSGHCIVLPLLFREQRTRNRVFSDTLATAFLKFVGVTLCMHQSRAFLDAPSEWNVNSFFFPPLSSSVLKLNWVFWSNCPSLPKQIECLWKTACTFIHPTSGFGKNSVTF